MIYDNTIDELLEEAKGFEKRNGYKAAFVSDWTPSNEHIRKINLKATKEISSTVNKYAYLYSIDDIGYKAKFEKFCAIKNGLRLYNSGFSLFANSTVSLYTVFKYLKIKGHQNILCFTPCYFASESALISLQFKLVFYSDIPDNNNTAELENIIKDKNIDCLLVTDPIFGFGVAYTIDKYRKLIEVCKQYNISLIIDYSYGNMVWSEDDHIVNHQLLEILDSGNINYFIVDCLPKKTFLNGIKFSLLFSNIGNIYEIEHVALFVEGSISAEQVKCYYACYDHQNATMINKIINQYIKKAKNTYKLLQSFLLNYEATISAVNSGIFAAVGIPRTCSSQQDMETAKKFLREQGVFIIPHTRYHFFDKSRYFFRLNLLLEHELIFPALAKILEK